MKRIGLVIASLAWVLLLTGCNQNKRLECRISQEEGGIKVNQIYTLNFDSKKNFKDATLKQDMILSEDALKVQELSTYKSQVENNFKNSSSYKNLNAKVSDNGKDTINITLDFSSEDANKISNGVDTSKVSYKDMKKQLEKNNYVCK